MILDNISNLPCSLPDILFFFLLRSETVPFLLSFTVKVSCFQCIVAFWYMFILPEWKDISTRVSVAKKKKKTWPSIYDENGDHQRRIAGNQSAELPVAAKSSSCMPLEQRSHFQRPPRFQTRSMKREDKAIIILKTGVSSLHHFALRTLEHISHVMTPFISISSETWMDAQ